MLGSPADALNYSFSVTYYGSKCNTNYEGPVVSIDVPSDAIISGYMGFTMSFHAFCISAPKHSRFQVRQPFYTIGSYVSSLEDP